MVYYVGGLKEIEALPFRRTRDYRIDNCPTSEVVQDLEEPWEKEKRIERVKQMMQAKLRKNEC